jgi:hypothetical protein
MTTLRKLPHMSPNTTASGRKNQGGKSPSTFGRRMTERSEGQKD